MKQTTLKAFYILRFIRKQSLSKEKGNAALVCTNGENERLSFLADFIIILSLAAVSIAMYYLTWK